MFELDIPTETRWVIENVNHPGWYLCDIFHDDPIKGSLKCTWTKTLKKADLLPSKPDKDILERHLNAVHVVVEVQYCVTPYGVWVELK